MDSFGVIPSKLEGESDIEYTQRIAQIIIQLNNERQESSKRIKILSDKNNKLTDENNKLMEEIKKKDQFAQIIFVIDKNPVNCTLLKIANDFYSNNKIDGDCIRMIASKVSAFSKIEVTNEKSGSISDEESVHNLWKQIINQIQIESSFDKVYRVVYEWGIKHPLTNQVLEIDFTIIPVNNSYLNWFNYMGGFELKKSPPPSKNQVKFNTSGGNRIKVAMTEGKKDEFINGSSVITQGTEQALSRAAMCVYSRWVASHYKGSHCAYCCCADGRGFAVTRFSLLDEPVDGNYVLCEISDFYLLPGWDGNEDISSLLLLKKLLFTPIDELGFLISLPLQLIDSMKGLSNKNQTIEEWKLGVFLGSGSYGAVYSLYNEQNSTSDHVVKMIIDERNSLRLLKEKKVLEALNITNVRYFPILIDSLSKVDEPKTIIALKLFPNAFNIPTVLIAFNLDFVFAKKLIRLLGPAMVSALKIAHDENYAHCDVRRANMLMQLSSEDFIRVSQADDIYGELAKIDISPCHRFLLNDWGEATKLSITNKNIKTSKDLQTLCLSMHHILNVVDISPTKGDKYFPAKLLTSDIETAEDDLKKQRDVNIEDNVVELQRPFAFSSCGIFEQSECKLLEEAVRDFKYEKIAEIFANVK